MAAQGTKKTFNLRCEAFVPLPSLQKSYQMGAGGTKLVQKGARPPFVRKKMCISPETHMMVEGYWGMDKAVCTPFSFNISFFF